MAMLVAEMMTLERERETRRERKLNKKKRGRSISNYLAIKKFLPSS